jgi:hypothetical protein
MKRWIGISFVLGVLLGVGVVRSQQGATGTQRIVQFENDDVKVWKSIVIPNAPLTMHRHEHGRVIIALKGGTMKIVEQRERARRTSGRRERRTGCPRMPRGRCTPTSMRAISRSK